MSSSCISGGVYGVPSPWKVKGCSCGGRISCKSVYKDIYIDQTPLLSIMAHNEAAAAGGILG